MGLDSITQTLSNPDCGLSKPHIPDNNPYISHRLIHSNRWPQKQNMTRLSLPYTVATVFPLLYYFFLCFSHIFYGFHTSFIFASCCPHLISLLTSYLNCFSSLCCFLFRPLSNSVLVSLIGLLSLLQCVIASE